MRCFLKHKWLGVIFLVSGLAGLIYAFCDAPIYKTYLGLCIMAASLAGAWYDLRRPRKWEKRFVHEDWQEGINFFPSIIISPGKHCCGDRVEVEMRPFQFKVLISEDGVVTILRDNLTARKPYDPLYVTIVSVRR